MKIQKNEFGLNLLKNRGLNFKKILQKISNFTKSVFSLFTLSIIVDEALEVWSKPKAAKMHDYHY